MLYHCFVIRSPSKLQDEFEKFSEKIELNLDSLVQNNPLLVVLFGDFNAKLKVCIKMTSTVSKVILFRMSHRSSVYMKLLRNQQIFQILLLMY